MKGINIAIRIVMMVIIFVAVALILWNVFGSPDCRAMANVTAEQLRQGFNTVGDQSFPSYNMMEIPEDPSVYVEKQVILCQDAVEYSYINQFFGGMPQYQIYYETFPEGLFSGGSGMWDEAYPWSGGAGSSLVFWGGLKGATVGLKSAGKALSKSGRFAMGSKNLLKNTRNTKTAVAKSLDTQTTQKIIKDYLDSGPSRRAWNKVKSFIGIGDAYPESGIIKEMQGYADNGLFKLGDDGLPLKDADGILVLSDKATDLRITKTTIDPFTFEAIETPQQVYSKVDDAGETILRTADELDSTAGWTRETWIPSEGFNDYVQEVRRIDKLQGTHRADDILGSFTTQPKGIVGQIGTTWKQGIRTTRLYKKTIGAARTKYARFTNKLKNAGYRTSVNVIDSDEAASHIRKISNSIDPLKNPDTYQEALTLVEVSGGTNLKNKVKSLYPGKNFADLTQLERQKVLLEFQNNIRGLSFIHETSVLNIDQKAMDAFQALDPDEFLVRETAINKIYSQMSTDVLDENGKIISKGIDNLDEFVASDLGKEGIEEIIGKQYDDIIEKYGTGGIPEAKIIEFQDNAIGNYYDRLFANMKADKLDNGIRAEKELGTLMGFLEQSTDTLPIDARGFGAQYTSKQIRKVAVLDGTALINPNSWVFSQLIGNMQTQYCEGNSVCLYVAAVETEDGHYMEEYVDDYMIRVWRPVSLAAQTAGLQAALMHVSKHPRFHMVSPCYAKAKIWKNDNYEGEPTIFVALKKCPLDMDEDGKSDVSNYCYADEHLINSYVAVWLTADVGMAVEMIVTAGIGKAIKDTASELSKAIIGFDLDVSTIGQAGAEALLAWPGLPFKSLTYEKTVEGSTTCQFEEFKSELQALKGD